MWENQHFDEKRTPWILGWDKDLTFLKHTYKNHPVIRLSLQRRNKNRTIWKERETSRLQINHRAAPPSTETQAVNTQLPSELCCPLAQCLFHASCGTEDTTAGTLFSDHTGQRVPKLSLLTVPLLSQEYFYSTYDTKEMPKCSIYAVVLPKQPGSGHSHRCPSFPWEAATFRSTPVSLLHSLEQLAQFGNPRYAPMI